ncbi:HAD family hydrolase [Vibrio ostreicida]|uniref:HAD family hydrolase n=1 Tax=Vibrio ostreicida TaxID=526588 RepID=UPI0009706406|nr:HAD family hydrolase [Vibrio ostreicida]
MSRPLYVFDLDETLINADCAMIWNEFLVEKGVVTQPDFIQRDQQLMASYAKGELRMEDYLTFSMAPLMGMTTQYVDRLVEECVEDYILPKQFPQAVALIEKLSRDNVQMVIISASVTFLVAAVGRRIGIPSALGIDLVERLGCYSADISGVPSYREGKVTRLEQWLLAQPTRFSSVHFFTDSINDLPLCEYADFTYLVNPCPRLKALTHPPQWTVLEWAGC